MKKFVFDNAEAEKDMDELNGKYVTSYSVFHGDGVVVVLVKTTDGKYASCSLDSVSDLKWEVYNTYESALSSYGESDKEFVRFVNGDTEEGKQMYKEVKADYTSWADSDLSECFKQEGRE